MRTARAAGPGAAGSASAGASSAAASSAGASSAGASSAGAAPAARAPAGPAAAMTAAVGSVRQVKLAEPAPEGTGGYPSSALPGAPPALGRGRQATGSGPGT